MRTAAFVSALVLAFVPSRLLAYEIARGAGGQALVGARTPVRLSVSVGDTVLAGEDRGELSADAACRRAALAWEAVTQSSAHFVRSGHELDPQTGSQVWIQAHEDSWPAAYGSERATLAFTLVQVDESTREIEAATVSLNAFGFSFSTTDTQRQIDLEGTVVHELGHALSLEHSCGEPFGTYPDCSQLPESVRAQVEDATMYPAASRGNIWQRDLAADDRDGLRALYGDVDAAPPVLVVSCACQPIPALVCEQADGFLVAYQDDQVFVRAGPASSCGPNVLGGLDLLRAFDLELTDTHSGKRAMLFAQRCRPCSVADASADPGPSQAPGCSCADAGTDPRRPLWSALGALLCLRTRRR